MGQRGTVICEYDDWEVIETENGLVLKIACDESEESVKEVYRFGQGEYEDKDIAELEKIVYEKGIDFDYCGELDDCSAYVFWVYE